MCHIGAVNNFPRISLDFVVKIGYIILMLIEKESPLSGNKNIMDIDVTLAQIEAWKGGELIQNAMPNLSADEREFIKTGITPEEWENTFGD